MSKGLLFHVRTLQRRHCFEGLVVERNKSKSICSEHCKMRELLDPSEQPSDGLEQFFTLVIGSKHKMTNKSDAVQKTFDKVALPLIPTFDVKELPQIQGHPTEIHKHNLQMSTQTSLHSFLPCLVVLTHIPRDEPSSNILKLVWTKQSVLCEVFQIILCCCRWLMAFFQRFDLRLSLHFVASLVTLKASQPRIKLF